MDGNSRNEMMLASPDTNFAGIYQSGQRGRYTSPSFGQSSRVRITDSCVKASGRAKKFDEHITELNKFFGALPSKKLQQQRNDPFTNERSSGATLKISEKHRNSSELGTLKFDDRSQNVGLSKWSRSTTTESRAERRNNAVLRQPITVPKERDILKDNNVDTDMVEEKIRRLTPLGEGWEKIKRKRSVGAVSLRSVDNDGELKWNVHNKLSMDSNLLPGDSSHGFRLNNRDEKNHTKPTGSRGKRAPRISAMAAAKSAANVPRVVGTLESREQAQAVTKNISISGPNNRKRPLPSGPSSPPITEWVGQRPHKMSRTRRTNVIPVLNNDEVQMQSEGCSPTEFVPRISIAKLSASEESGAGENRINDKGMASRDPEERTANTSQSVGPSAISIKKSKSSAKPPRNATKPPRNARSVSEKSGSKSGRPLKKISNRKNLSRLGHVTNGGSADCSGEPNNDREELLRAANLACSFSFKACPSTFWKKSEALFASIGPDEKSYLTQQVQDDYCRENLPASGSVSLRSDRCINSLDKMDSVEPLQKSLVRGCSDAEENIGRSTPLYQRVLSALIMEDEIEEFEESGFWRPRNSANNSHVLSENKSKLTDNTDFFDPVIGAQTRKNGNARKIIPCNGTMDVDRSPSSLDYICNGELTHKDGFMHSDAEVLFRLSRFDHAPKNMLPSNSGVCSLDFQYEQMGLEEKLEEELHSIGLFLDSMPALKSKEDEGIDHELAQLEKRLIEKIRKKKPCFDKIDKAIQEGKDIGRDPEQVAMDKLVELAYKKILATKGAYASKHGIPKVSKQAALAFCKRTLVRCQKFENSGISCFSDTALREVLCAPPPQSSEMELLSGVNPADANETCGTSTRPSDQVGAKKGTISNQEKEKELSLNDVGGSISRATAGAKGKRSLRGSNGKRKTKSKPKQTAQPSISGVNKIAETVSEPAGNHSSSKDALGLSGLPLKNIDAIEEPGVDDDKDAPQDLNSWFNFDVDGLQEEQEDAIGLEIPMDNLSDLMIF